MAYAFPKAAFVPGTTTPAKGISYLPQEVTSITNDPTSGQRFALYYPLGKPIDYGWTTDRWPVLAWSEMLGFSLSTATFADTSDQVMDSTLFFWQALSRGIAVAFAQVTAADAAKAYTGRGFFHPPGHVGGYYEDVNRPLSYKDAAHFVQHLRFKAATYRLDPGAICLAGGSSGSHIAAWNTFGPERRWDLGQGGQYEYSTIPNCYISRGLCLAWWEAHDQADAVFSAGFPDVAGGAVVAATLAAVGSSAAESLQFQRASSILGFTAMRASAPPPCLLHAFEPNNSFKFGQPFPSGTELSSNTHSIWDFCALKAQWKAQMTVMATSGVTTLAQLGGAGGGLVDKSTGNFDTNYTLETNPKVPLGQWARGDVIDWLVAHIQAPNVWYSATSRIMRWETMVNATGRFIVSPNGVRTRGVRITCTDPTNGILVGEYASGTTKAFVAPGAAVNGDRSVFFEGDGPLWVKAEANTATLLVEEV